MKKIEKFIYIAIGLSIIAIIAGFFIDSKTVMMILFALLLLVGYVIYKEKIGQQLVIAFLMAIALTSSYYYEYNSFNLFIGGINLFPLICWTFGLVVLREIYEKVKIKNKFLIVSIIYIIVLFLVEYIGYYLLKIKLNSNFPSLFGIGIIHGSIGLKLFYILAGPVYLKITDYLHVK